MSQTSSQFNASHGTARAGESPARSGGSTIFPKNAWYVAAFAEDISNAPFARTILAEHLLLFRTSDGALTALADTCPHRLAPMSEGRLIDDCIECPYHGLRFASNGDCVFNPHAPGTIPPRMRLRAYPVVERHTLVWVWMGDPARANPDAIPDLSYLVDGGAWKTVHSYFHFPFGADLMIDNVMDLSHLEYLHRGSLSSGYRAETQYSMSVLEEDGNVRVSWVLRNFLATSHARAVNDAGERTDSYRDSVWIAPCIVRNELVQVPTGTPRESGRLRYNTHICTPETHRSMHDFALRSRNFDLYNKDIDRKLIEGQKPVVADEDGVMLARIQARMGDTPFEEFNPVMFSIDAGPVRVRRALERMVREESAS